MELLFVVSRLAVLGFLEPSIFAGLGLALGAILGCLLLTTSMWLLGSGCRMRLGLVLASMTSRNYASGSL